MISQTGKWGGSYCQWPLLTILSPPTAEHVHSWITRRLPDRPHPPIKRPINWLRWISGATVLTFAFTAAYVAWPYVLPIIQNRNVWAAISLVCILLFTSGHMFNQIRKVPYVAGDGRGGISYFAGGFQNQYGMETQIVAAMCKFTCLRRCSRSVLTVLVDGVLSFAAITLAIKAPRIADPKAQQISVFVWGGVLIVMYSFLLYVFRIKNGGYPFSLPPFL